MLDRELIINLRTFTIKKDKRQNELLEEAMRDLLKKYGKKVPQNKPQL
jgi:hypothetical protein